jgi:tetratricopeptide (TPR) repeat protein
MSGNVLKKPSQLLRDFWWLWAPFVISFTLVNAMWLLLVGLPEAYPWPVIEIIEGCALSTLFTALPIIGIVALVQKRSPEKLQPTQKWLLLCLLIAAVVPLSIMSSLVWVAKTAMTYGLEDSKQSARIFDQVEIGLHKLNRMGIHNEEGNAVWLLASAHDLGSAPVVEHINNLLIEHCTGVIDRDPKTRWVRYEGSAYDTRGEAYLNLTQYQKAIEDFSKGIELHPKSGRAYYERGLAYAKLGKSDLADKDQQKAKELSYKPEQK